MYCATMYSLHGCGVCVVYMCVYVMAVHKVFEPILYNPNLHWHWHTLIAVAY